MERKPQRKMTNIEVVETSGVDHPAHLREGWLVKKSVSPAEVDALFGNPSTKEVETVATDEKPTGPTQEEFDALVAKNAALEVEKAEAVAKAEKVGNWPDPSTPVVKAAETSEEILKAMPEEYRTMIAKAQADAVETRELLNKERDARLDRDAVDISKAAYKHIAMDHTKVAPALRKFALIDSETAAEIATVLKAAEGQLESAGIFAEIGKSVTTDTEGSSLDQVVKALQASTPGLEHSEAIAKALEADPSLYFKHQEGK